MQEPEGFTGDAMRKVEGGKAALQRNVLGAAPIAGAGAAGVGAAGLAAAAGAGSAGRRHRSNDM